MTRGFEEEGKFNKMEGGARVQDERREGERVGGKRLHMEGFRRGKVGECCAG